MKSYAWDYAVNYNVTKIAYEQINWVEQEQPLHYYRKPVHRVENGGSICEQMDENRPQISHIPKKT